MNKSKPDSLFQSMEKWIDLHREIHGGSYNAALDSFETWAAEQRNGQTLNGSDFHKAVIDGVIRMRSELGRVVMVDEIIVEQEEGVTKPTGYAYSTVETTTFANKPKPLSAMELAAIKHEVYHPRGPIGGPLLDTGIDPLSFKDGVRHSYMPVDEPHVPLSETLSVEELRQQAVEMLERNKAYLASPGLYYGELQDEAKRAVAIAEMRIEMLDGVIERRKERGGKPLRLKGKHHPEGTTSTLLGNKQ